MQPAEKVNPLFIVKLILLCCLLYLGFLVKVPQFVKPTQAQPLNQLASPDDSAVQQQETKQIRKLYYQVVSDLEPEEVAI